MIKKYLHSLNMLLLVCAAILTACDGKRVSSASVITPSVGPVDLVLDN